ncbi:hypothetical protein BTA51_22090 [Hahella sp. CCB-MM4]|uniref:hypothetical protein n=1 Tax=Hahella sp. (strain CCB-MM4) TaxID=1926491 RepID=UPI000B9B538F|nr:hypothetical protein [Hahella sp. CCB-MM4]OZG71075.1 hypothetical protein BTA51_22090 [Hahella sp. CCB-MM4]
MAELSQRDIDNRIKYLEEAKSLDFLNAVFCIHFYNTDVKRWGPRPKPENISPDEVFDSFTQEEFEQAIEKCKKLINHGRKLGDLAFDRTEAGEQKFQKENAIYDQVNGCFNEKNLGRAFNSGMRDMR